MAHHLFIDSDPLRICPYDMTHRVCSSRFQYHLLKCRKNHPDAPIKICPFNATHHIPLDEYTAHIVNCPNAEVMEKRKFPDRLEDLPLHGYLSLPAYRNHNIPTDEDWDAELENANASETPAGIASQSLSDVSSRIPIPITIPMAARIAGASRWPNVPPQGMPPLP